jgi:hypothetical protein
LPAKSLSWARRPGPGSRPADSRGLYHPIQKIGVDFRVRDGDERAGERGAGVPVPAIDIDRSAALGLSIVRLLVRERAKGLPGSYAAGRARACVQERKSATRAIGTRSARVSNAGTGHPI